jgi:hypothetical protein
MWRMLVLKIRRSLAITRRTSVLEQCSLVDQKYYYNIVLFLRHLGACVAPRLSSIISALISGYHS